MNTDNNLSEEICAFECVVLKDMPFSYSFSVDSNSIHSLFSDNPQVSLGLLRCLAGFEHPIEGNIILGGRKYRRLNSKKAVQLGIEIVDTSNKTFSDMSVLENIYCERKHSGLSHAQSRALAKRQFMELIHIVGVNIDLKRQIKELAPAERKLIELFRSIIANPRLLCLEEGVLRDIEDYLFPGIRKHLRAILLDMVNNGLTLLIASNDMNEISKYSNRVSIFKQNGEARTINVAQVDKYYLMQIAYGFITNKTELAQDNFELFYYQQLYQEIINSLIFPIIATDTHHNIIIHNQEIKKVYFDNQENLIGKKIQEVLGLSKKIISDIEKELLFIPETRVFRLPDIFENTNIFVSPIMDNMGSYMGMLYVFNKNGNSESLFGSYLNKANDINYEYKISELIHEVKNPLNIMLNYLSLIQKESSLQTIKKESEFIAREVSRINRLLEKLNNKKIGEVSIKTNKIFYQVLIKDIYEFFGPTMKEKHIELHYELDGLYCIGVDDDSLRQVFINIILNAIEAMTLGGMIKITGKCINDDGIDYVEIKVNDNAGGILPACLPYIFNPFYTTKINQNSHGIGLSVTREIVERLGGAIEVDSEVGVGSTFTLTLKQQ